MQLTKEDIDSFIEMWDQEFGERLSAESAESEAKRLIEFFLSLAEARLDDAGKSSSNRDTMPA